MSEFPEEKEIINKGWRKHEGDTTA